MAASKKPVAKAVPAKKTVATVSKNKPTAQKAAAKPAPKKAAPAKAATPAKKAAPAKAPASKKAAPAPAKPVAKKAAPAPAKKAAPAPAKKVAPVKAAPAPAKKVAVKAVAEKPVAKKAAAPAPAPKVEKKPVVAPKAVAAKPATTRESKADQKAAQKRQASAVQRIQAKIATSIPKPQPKPAPMPTVMPGREEKKSQVVVAHRRLESKPREEETNVTMINYQPDFTRSILDSQTEKDSTPLYRYSDDELNEFRELITNRLATARKELAYQQGLITHKDATGTEDTENRYMNMEDGSGAMEREQLAQMASRMIQFINHLEKAMVRIENKTYGICRVTGKLIDKARLRAVPHATLSIEAKNMMNK